MTVNAELRLKLSSADWLGWSVFLGISWTWCIGMFLPVLLIRDFGVWGWIVFAVPNVLGAAAMGWVLRSPQESLALAAGHRQACMMFSGVTIAFHMFFVVSVLAREPIGTSVTGMQPMDLALGSVIALSIVMYLFMTRQAGSDRALAAITMLISLAAMVLFIAQIRNTPHLWPQLSKPVSPKLLALAPVCLFGFGACPYLDLTFHRARQHTTAAPAAFGAGFGVVFLLMIIFTLIYSQAILWQLPRLLGATLLVHMTVQSSFTLAAHARELRRHGARAAIVAAGLTGISWIALWSLRRGDVVKDLHAGEFIYRVFMGFYGLVFPAYVWLAMSRDRPTRRNLLVWVLAVALAGPMFWMGFVADRFVWLVPGLAVVILARLLCRSHPIQQNSAPI
jgi:hypothetical protein